MIVLEQDLPPLPPPPTFIDASAITRKKIDHVIELINLFDAKVFLAIVNVVFAIIVIVTSNAILKPHLSRNHQVYIYYSKVLHFNFPNSIIAKVFHYAVLLQTKIQSQIMLQSLREQSSFASILDWY